MEIVETLIPDNEGNHLVVALNFCDDTVQEGLTQIPSEFGNFVIADISIKKLFEDRPLNPFALYKMCNWILEQLVTYSNAIFWFICSTGELKNNHPYMTSAQYRWNLFDYFYRRNSDKLKELGIESNKIIVGTGHNETFIRVFYRMCHAPVIHIVTSNIEANHGK